MELKNKKIVFLGDSITQGVGASKPENCYVSVFEKNTGAKCVNLGISGTRIARQHKLTENEPVFDRDFCSRIPDIDEDSNIVVIVGGTNDFGHGNAPMGAFGDHTPQTFYGALSILMRGLIERYPEIPIIFMTPLHRRNELERSALTGHAFRDYVQAIRIMAEYYSLPVVDLYAGVGIQPNIPSQQALYCPDGLHPNAAGHEKIATMLASFLLHVV